MALLLLTLVPFSLGEEEVQRGRNGDLYPLLENSSSLGSLTQQHWAEPYRPSHIHSTNTLSPSSAPSSPRAHSPVHHK